MSKIRNPAELEELREQLQNERDPEKPVITICNGTGCHAYNCERVIEAIKSELVAQKQNGNVEVRATGCHGFCERGPIVVINPAGIFYQRVTPDDASEIVSETIINHNVIDRLLYVDPVTDETITNENDVNFYKKQTRLVFGDNVRIDPANILDYIAIGGYSALAKALPTMKPEEIIDEIKASGLRGRGGAGFPTGRKWEACRTSEGETKYVICNADEGDPGAYMDRSLLEGNPHSILEGMIIGAFAIGSSEGYVYVRHEYPLAVKNLEIAIKQAEE
ncbi:MAG: NADH-quinone oxidoreductase subunit F [Candidatus Methanogaster sp.]|nr:MAG: NADH-quinone oxidoreductase subunit F [ANME-2 cluster archaeon]